ncbi:MAG: elongator complex protein 3 [bacterium]
MRYKKFIPQQYPQIYKLLDEIRSKKPENYKALKKLLVKYPKDKHYLFSKSDLIKAFRYLKKMRKINEKETIPSILIENPVRSMSGVNVVSVLTRPNLCPGQCIFCPNDILMPKSYIRSEPSCRRALNCRFDPYEQVTIRMKALTSTGHPADKIELLILGGTWNSYSENYRVWFVRELFRALNEFSQQHNYDEQVNFNIAPEIDDIEVYKKLNYNEILKSELYQKNQHNIMIDDGEGNYSQLVNQQIINETSVHRCVGLAVETRPDLINFRQLRNFRKLGVTKVQIGVQTLRPSIRKINKINISLEDIKYSFKILRLTGFKILAHVMFNLYTAAPEDDYSSYKEIFNSGHYKPDELKIYPAVVTENTELNDLYQKGLHQIYKPEQLLELLAKCFEITPSYCRLPRVIRDIPSTEIIAGNKISNLREVVEEKMFRENRICSDIRAREIKNLEIKSAKYSVIKYNTEVSDEYFLQYTNSENKIIALLRLTLALRDTGIYSTMIDYFPELENSAIIREIHVYGRSLKINHRNKNSPQHSGFGKALIDKAMNIAGKFNFKKLAVISSVGTREYYRKGGFYDGELYQFKNIHYENRK